MATPLIAATPLFAAGALLTLAGFLLWLQGPRSPLIVALAVLLVFDGDLHLIRALFLLPDLPESAWRLWPLFDVVVTASALAFLCLLLQKRVAERTLDAWLSSIIGGAALVGLLVITMPQLYWGDGSGNGPLAVVDGLRSAAMATVGWALLRTRSLTARPVLGVLGVAFLLGPIFWITTDILYVWVLGADLPHLNPGPAHVGRLLAVIPVVAAGVDLARRALAKAKDGEQRLASRLVLLCLLPALSAVLLLDAVVWGLIAPVAADLLIVALFGPLWVLTPALVLSAAALRAPGQVAHALVAHQPPPLAPPEASMPAPVVHWDTQ